MTTIAYPWVKSKIYFEKVSLLKNNALAQTRVNAIKF